MAAVPLRISLKTPGAILQPQPPPWESEVRRGSVVVSVVVMGEVMGGVPWSVGCWLNNWSGPLG